jgi:hypothetical protein
VAVRAGPRSGVEAHDGADLAVGADARLSFSLSPLTLNPSFDYFFTEGQSLYQISLNAFYHLPIRARVAPYGGLGVGLTAFSIEQTPDTIDDITDAHGIRIGLNVIAGVCFDLPIVAPYAQVTAGVGEIDLVTITAGLLYDFGQGRRDWDRCGRRRSEPEAGR